MKIVFIGLALSSLVLHAGCMKPTIESKAFNEMTRIVEFADANATNRCIVFELESGHQARICAFGRLAEGQKIEQLLPFVTDAKLQHGANAIHGRIPKQLLAEAGLTDPFEESDPYWLTDVVSDIDEKLIAVRVAVGEKDRRFYLEYGWSL